MNHGYERILLTVSLSLGLVLAVAPAPVQAQAVNGDVSSINGLPFEVDPAIMVASWFFNTRNDGVQNLGELAVDVGGAGATADLYQVPLQDTKDAYGISNDWIIRNRGIPFFPFGPYEDHSTSRIVGLGPPATDGLSRKSRFGGHFAVMEDFGDHEQVNLVTPCLDLTAATDPHLVFWMHSENINTPSSLNQNFLSVDAITNPGGAVTLDVHGPVGHLGPDWTIQVASLAPFIGSVVQLRFRGRNDAGTHLIGIDDIAVVDFLPTPGQPPQPGASVLEIEDALNVNGIPVETGLGGLYFVAVDTLDAMTLDFLGEPLQAIVFLGGPLAPATATFPPHGQLDLALPGVTVLGAGTEPGFLNGLFNLDATGHQGLTATVPASLGGTVATFQAVIFNSANVVAFSNAIEVTFR